MYSTAYRILADKELANDVLQEAFIAVFHQLDKFEFRSKLSTWIRSILVHKTLKMLKKQKAITFSNLSDKVDFVIWEEPLNGEHLERAILSLPDGYRTIFTLIEIEGYKHKDVAKILNISEGTSKSQLFHAKKYLKTKLKELMN